jgi:DNA-binding transcriptional regulator YhcF (GntR family)
MERKTVDLRELIAEMKRQGMSTTKTQECLDSIIAERGLQ